MFLVLFIVFGGARVLWGNHRSVLLPLAIACLAIAYLVERSARPKEPLDLTVMKSENVDWTTISVSHGRLVVSDRWDLSNGVQLDDVPAELHVTLHCLVDRNYRIITSIAIHSSSPSVPKGTSMVPVDSGWLYFGDADIFSEGLTTKALASMIDAGFDGVAGDSPLRVVVSNPQSVIRGVVVATGLGDGEYQLTWGSGEGYWQLEAEFLSDSG